MRILFLLLLISNYTFGQKFLEGKYYQPKKEECIEFCNIDTYTFHNNGIFEYAEEGELGIVHYGKGHYTLTKDLLVLNFDLTEIKYPGYYIAKTYSNSNTQIALNLSVYDLNNKPLPEVSISLFSDETPIGGTTDKEGKLTIKVPKTNEKGSLLLTYNSESMYEVENFNLNLNYEVAFYLTKTPMNPLDIGKAVKDEIISFEVIKLKKDELVVRHKGKMLTLKKKSKTINN